MSRASDVLGWARRNPAALVLVALLLVAARSAYGLLPRTHALTISGGGILGERHLLAKILQGEAAKKGIVLTVRPVSDDREALEQVGSGKLDLAFVQGGPGPAVPGVEHAATVLSEAVHLLVKPGLRSLADLKGRSIDLGPKTSEAREIGLALARFLGFVEGVDYIETNHTGEQLLAMPPQRLPDAAIVIASAPSPLVGGLVHDRRYVLTDLVIGEGFSLRNPWATTGQIAFSTYEGNPPSPERTMLTVAVSTYLVAGSKVDAEAVSAVLEVLFGPSVSSVLRRPIDEKRIAAPSGYPASAGLSAYLARNDSLLTQARWHELAGMLGLAAALGGAVVVLLVWLRGARGQEAS
jgi:TRAP-type uncharacterized transport system substrate-binding protein